MNYARANFAFLKNRSVEVREEYFQRLQTALKPLLGAPDIAASLRKQQPHALFRLLHAKRKTVRLGDQELVAQLLSRRDLFVAPVRESPSVFRFHEIGTRLLLASKEATAKGPRLATLYVVVGLVPLFPLAQYLVRPQTQGSWDLFGKVPMSATYEWWKASGIAAAIALAIGIAAYCGFAMAK